MATAAVSFAERISEYHDECWKALRQSLKKVCRKAEGRHIHHSHVGIKKLTALYQFIESYERGYDSRRELKPLRRIFKLLGRMRDQDRMLALCRTYKVDESILKKEPKAIKKMPAKIRALMDKRKGELRKTKKRNSRLLHQSNAASWRSYLYRCHTEISDTLAAPPPTGDLHLARRSVKYFLYNAQLPGSAKGIVTAAEVRRLDQLQEAIGVWHDMTVFIDLLCRADYKHKHPELYTQITDEESKMLRQLRAM